MPISFRYFLYLVFVKGDIVHVHTPNPLACLALLFNPFSKKVIITHHADTIKKGILGFITKPITNKMYEKADCIVATSVNYFNSSCELNNYKNKTQIIPIGIANNKFDNLVRKLKKPYKVLSVGRFVEYKGFEYLLEAISRLDEFELDLVGEGHLLNVLREKYACSRIRFHGNVSEEKKMQLYAEASIFCLPSINRAEAYGVVILEAMQAALPLVTTDIGTGTSYLNIDKLTGFVISPRNVQQIIDALKKIVATESQYESYAKSSRERYINNFTLDKMSSHYTKMYSMLTSQRRI